MNRNNTNPYIIFLFIFLIQVIFAASAYSQLTISITSTDPLCYAGATGTASVMTTGGTQPYSYIWSNGGATQTIFDLTNGNYAVTVTDQNGSTASGMVHLTDPPLLLSTLLLDDSLLTCLDRTIIASNDPFGGIPPYNFEWTLPNTNVDTNQSFQITDPGQYVLKVYDAHECLFQKEFTINSSGFPVLTTYVIDSISCNTNKDGNAAVQIQGDTPPYQIQWSNGDQDTLLNDVGVGSYSVTVTDAGGCSNVAYVYVPQPQQLGIEILKTDITCFGGMTGTVLAQVIGGTEPYSYFWNNGGMSQGMANLPAGPYAVTVTDHRGCQIVGNTFINQGSEINVVVIGTNVTCYGGNNGSASAIATNGVFPYSYTWSTGGTTSQIHNLVAGKYYVSVVDGNNCVSVDSITIQQAFEITLDLQSTPENFGMSDGTATATPISGISPYTWAWSNGGTTSKITNLTSGDYYVTVTDKNGCVATGEVYVEADNCDMELHLRAVNVSCYGKSDGGVFPEFDVVGIEPYTFNWSNGSTEPVLIDVKAGNYKLTITDNTNCSEVVSVTVTQPGAFNIGYLITQPTGPDQPTGKIKFSIIGGNSPYRIVFKDIVYTGSTEITIPNIDPGTYTITIIDNKGCEQEVTFTVNNYNCFITAIIAQELLIQCNGDNTGRLCAGAEKNIGPVTFSWTNQSFTPCIDNVKAGTYSVIVTDTVGCTASATFTVTEPKELDYSNLNVVQGTGANGSISLIIEGGTPAYTYNWTKNGTQFATSRDLAGLSKGTYILRVTDANICVKIFDPIVIVPLANKNLISEQEVKLYPNPVSDYVIVEFESSVSASEAVIQISDLSGRIIVKNTAEMSNNRLKINTRVLNPGLYLLKINVGTAIFAGKIIKTP